MPEQSTSVRHQHQLLQPCSCSHRDLTKVSQNASRICCPGAGDVACPPSKMQARVRTTLASFDHRGDDHALLLLYFVSHKPLWHCCIKDMPSMRNTKGEKAPIIMSGQNELVSKPQKQRNCWKPGTCKPFGSKQLRLKVFAARKAIHLGRDSMYIPESTRKIWLFKTLLFTSNFSYHKTL